MLDFLVIATRSGKRGIIEIYPKFIIKKSSDLMIRGGDFYAIWIEERGLWSTDEQDAVDLIDRELDRYAEENCKRFDDNYRVMHMWDAETGMIDTWHKYCQKQMKDQFHKFMRMITVYLDITAPLYWWKEFDTYKVGTVANSCSTMHKIAEKEFTLENFSCEHLLSYWGEEKVNPTIIYPCTPMQHLNQTIACLNVCRKKYLETKDKKYWWQMIQLLPSSYNQRRTVMLNYEVLANIYKSRRNHKLDEWHTFCDWIEGLPYSALITGTAV